MGVSNLIVEVTLFQLVDGSKGIQSSVLSPRILSILLFILNIPQTDSPSPRMGIDPSASMGRTGRRQNPPNDEDLISEERYHPSSRAHEPHSRSHAAQGRPRNRISRSTCPFESHQYPQNTTWTNSQSHNTASSGPMQNPPHFDQAFIIITKRLIERLVQSFNTALNQIEQRYPDLDEDAMDWQPEEEIVIPPTNDTS